MNTAHVHKLIPEEKRYTVQVLEPAVAPSILEAFCGLDEIRAAIQKINLHSTRIDEESFHLLERQFIKLNEKIIVPAALPVSQHLRYLLNDAERNWDSLHHFEFVSHHTTEEALLYRYVYVPLAYRLGYYTVAAKLAQMTFQSLFPTIDEQIRSKITTILGHREAEAHALIHERFAAICPSNGYSYSRPKTPHSIWKKAGSSHRLLELSKEDFSKVIDDYLMVVWVMPAESGENRSDALQKAEALYCSDIELFNATYKRQCNISEGYPVTMMYAVWHDIPVEIQFLGGEILGWLTAMDYGKYKVGTWLDKIEKRLTAAEWKARGNTMLRIYEETPLQHYEEGKRAEFHEILLKEVLGESVSYDSKGPEITLTSEILNTNKAP